MDDNELMKKLDDIQHQIDLLKLNPISTLGSQSTVDGSVQFLGDTIMRQAIIYALTTGNIPTDADACGLFWNAYGETFDGGTTYYHLGGVNNGSLQFGLRTTDGAALFSGGQGTIDADGINLNGIMYALRHYAENPTATIKRYGRFEMLYPDGKDIPALAMTFTDAATSTELVVNGGFETGDMTGWTGVGGASTTAHYSGSYSCQVNPDGGVITSDSMVVSASSYYFFSIFAKGVPNLKIELSWYDAGSVLIRTDTVYNAAPGWMWTNITANAYSPGLSASCKIILTFTSSVLYSSYVDDVSFQNISLVRKLLFTPDLEYMDGTSYRKVVSGVKELFLPSALTATLGSTILQPSAGIDTYIRSTNPTSNYGTETTMNIGESNASTQIGHALVKFDLTGLPAGLTFTGATLNMTIQADYSSNARTMRCYQLLRNWTEAGATYNKFNGTDDWQTAGGTGANDMEQTDMGNVALTATETVNTSKDIVLDTDIVQGWYDGSINNYGVLIKNDTETDDMYAWYSSDYSTAGYRPKLTPTINLFSNGAYKYKVTFVDAGGETTVGAVSNTITVTDYTTSYINLSAIPIGPYGTTSRKIYRTEAGGSTYKLLTTIADNTTTTYTDLTPDASLGAEPGGTNLSGTRPILPRSWTVFATEMSSNATLTFNTSESGLVNTSAANANNGDYFLFDFWAEEGTYTLNYTMNRFDYCGIFDTYIDNVSVATGDSLYAAAAGIYYIQHTGVAIVGSGYHQLKCVINGRDAGSSDYAFACYQISGYKTSDGGH